MSNITSAPKVIIDDLVYQKIMHFIDKSSVEVSGLGKIVITGNGDIRVVDAMLLPQRNTATTTDIKPEDVGKAMFLMKDAEGDLRFWWHSHVNMPVFWSGTDQDTIVKLASGGWFVSTVFNKKREMRTCIATSEPFLGVIDDVRTEISRTLDSQLMASWDKEYQEKVTDLIPKVVPVAAVSRFHDPFPAGRFAGISAHLGGGYRGFDEWSESSVVDYPDFVRKTETSSIHSLTKNDVEDTLKTRNLLEDQLEEVENELDAFVEIGLLTESERFGKTVSEDTWNSKGKA